MIKPSLRPASLWRDGFRAVEVEFRGLLRLSRMNLNGERHTCRALKEDRFVLDPVGAKDEVGKGLVGGDGAGAPGLR
jgi:hypothetical protein